MPQYFGLNDQSPPEDQPGEKLSDGEARRVVEKIAEEIGVEAPLRISVYDANGKRIAKA